MHMRDEMAEATRLTRSGRLTEATALIKRTLGATGGAVDNPEHPPHPVGYAPPPGDPTADRVGEARRLAGRVGGPGPAPGG